MGNFGRTSCGVSFGILLMLTGLSCGNYPVLDVDTNMRIVLVPYDTPVGTIIYRLRASDSDNNFPLSFEVLGSIGKSILSLRFLGCDETESLCQADVVLKKALDKGRTYEFQLQVKDTDGDYTKVHSVITATSGTANFNPTFMPRIIHLDESTPVGTELEKFIIAKNQLNSRHVFLEIRDKGDRIALRQRLVSNNKTEGTLLLKKMLDYETEPWFTFQLLAMNAYTNISCDTRNILVSQVIVAVHDVQDTPPYFTSLPASVELKSSMKPGDLIATVGAEDGDKQNKRLIRYGFLTDSNPFVVFFNLDPMSGEIHLRRNLTELLTMAKPNEPIEMTVIAEEIIPDLGRAGGKSSSRSSSSSYQDNNSRAMGKITFWFGRDSSFGPAVFSSDKYVGEVNENSVAGTLVHFGSMEPRVSHQHPKEIIALSLYSGGAAASNKIDNGPTRHKINSQQQHDSGNSNLISSSNHNNNDGNGPFQVLPSQGSGNFSFEIRVTDSKQLDYETTTEFTFLVVAVTSSGMSSEAQVTIHVRDLNDFSPVFTQSEYHVELPEHPPKGTKVLQVQAIDKDTKGNFGKVTYSNIIGSNAFRLDPVTGDITVERPDLIDRELEPEIRLYVEAKDGGYSDTESHSVRNLGTAMVVIKLTDKNDHAPEFLQKYYQAVLNPGLSELKEPLFLKAFDPDDGVNAEIRYQVKDSRFYVDPLSGEFRLRGGFHRDPKDGDNPFLGSVKVYAYDLGNPKMMSETSVQLFSEEMVTREIQFIFPATADRIRKNKTTFEIMLSKLSGGVVAIQNVAPYHRYNRAGNQIQGEDLREPETTSTDPGSAESSVARFRQNNPENDDSNSALSRRAAELSSPSDKSIVTATVQYPVSATPTRVDLSQIPSVYTNPENGPGGGGGNNAGSDKPDTDRIKIYEAENRALFWILISFLLILLLLFIIFLCCVYCPWCWLYGHCYSKGDKVREHSGRSLLLEKRRSSVSHSRHKTYPEKMDDEEAEYDREFPRPPPARGHRHTRREAWSGDDRKSTWRSTQQSPRSMRRYRGSTPPPRSRKVGPHPSHETDVALEDWEFDGAPTRPRDQAEEIGSRWQLQQQQQQSQQPLPPQGQQMIPVMPMPVPVGHGGQPPRRVAFGGHPGQVDDSYMRRSQEVFVPVDETQLQRGGYIARPAQSLPAPDERAVSHLQQRKTRFFRTETGEVLQFGDYDGDDQGKELLMKRYINEQQPNELLEQLQQQQRQSFGSQHRIQTPGASRSQPRLEEVSRVPQHEQQQQVDRPKAAIVTRRNQKNVSLSKDVTFEDDDDERGRSKDRDRGGKDDSRSRSNKRDESTTPPKQASKKSLKSLRSESESEGERERERKERESRENEERDRRNRRVLKELEKKRQRETKSPTPPTDEGDSHRSRSPTRRPHHSKDKDKIRVSKSPSRSKNRSESPKHKSKSKSPTRSKSGTRSRSVSPDEREKRRAKAKQQQEKLDREAKHYKLKRHHHIQQHSKASSKDETHHEKDRDKEREYRREQQHRHAKQKDSKQQRSFKDSREELPRDKSKSQGPSLTSLPDETETRQMTSTEDTKTSSTTEMHEESPPSNDRDHRSGGDEENGESRSRASRRRSSVFRQQSSEDATQMQSMVDINIIPPSSAMTESTYSPRDTDGMMSDAAPPTPDAEGDSSAQQPEAAISSRDRAEDEDYDRRSEHGDGEDDGAEEESEAVVIEAESQPGKGEDEPDGKDEESSAPPAQEGDDENGKLARTDTIAEPENDIVASRSTLDIAEAEAAAAAVAPSDSVDIPTPGDGDVGEPEPEPSERREEDDDSGIGMAGYLSRRNKMMEKKSVFTIAYDEVAQSSMMRPDTTGSNAETESEIPTTTVK